MGIHHVDQRRARRKSEGRLSLQQRPVSSLLSPPICQTKQVVSVDPSMHNWQRHQMHSEGAQNIDELEAFQSDKEFLTYDDVLAQDRRPRTTT